MDNSEKESRSRWIFTGAYTAILLVVWLVNAAFYGVVHILLFANLNDDLNDLTKICFENEILYIHQHADNTPDTYQVRYDSWLMVSKKKLSEDTYKEIAATMNKLKKYKIDWISLNPEQKMLDMLLGYHQLVGFTDIAYFDRVYNTSEEIDWSDVTGSYKIKKVVRINDHWWKINYS